MRDRSLSDSQQHLTLMESELLPSTAQTPNYLSATMGLLPDFYSKQNSTTIKQYKGKINME